MNKNLPSPTLIVKIPVQEMIGKYISVGDIIIKNEKFIDVDGSIEWKRKCISPQFVDICMNYFHAVKECSDFFDYSGHGLDIMCVIDDMFYFIGLDENCTLDKMYMTNKNISEIVPISLL